MKVFIDSSLSFSEDYIKQHDLGVIPIQIKVGTLGLVGNFDAQDFYNAIITGIDISFNDVDTDYITNLVKLFSEKEEVIYIGSSSITDYHFKEIEKCLKDIPNVHVLDCMGTESTLALIVDEIIKLKDWVEIENWFVWNRPLVVSKTTQKLKSGYSVNEVSTLSSLLNWVEKPIFITDNRTDILRYLLSIIKNRNKVIISYTGCPDEIIEFEKGIKDQSPNTEILIIPTSPITANYIGLNNITISFFDKQI